MISTCRVCFLSWFFRLVSCCQFLLLTFIFLYFSFYFHFCPKTGWEPPLQSPAVFCFRVKPRHLRVVRVRPPPRHSSISWKHTQYLVLFQISRIILPNKNRPIIKIVRIHVMTAGAGQTCQRCLTMFEMESKILEEDAHSRFKECLVALSHFKNPL